MLWLIFIVVTLLLLIWGGGYLLSSFEMQVDTWIMVTLSALVVLGAVGWVLFRRWRAEKRAQQLEAEILRQSEQQAAAVAPDRRAEIAELQKRVQQGIKALQETKVGKKHGRRAIYSLPWYVIIGPPGAGKTTALRHSGLVFPFSDPNGGGAVRGVGGTRNCDWWFTNEGILLDTAGRYTTDDSDREEWDSFLGLLRKYRPKIPINGLLVALSVSDLFEATDEQISTYATKLRARVDEIMTRLDMVLPVYLIFTKADLLGGFVEFWGDLRKSERDQILGATLPVSESVGEQPGKTFAEEFDRIGSVLHARALQVITKEAMPEARARVFQFPMEFQALKPAMEQLVEELFRRNSFQENPMFRGFYFTSGTQEGAPFQRLMGNMARALGIRQAPMAQAYVESKSYFVTDVFRRVVFPDQHLAGRTATELRRQRIVQGSLAAAAVLLGSLILFPGISSMRSNRGLIQTTERVSDQAAAVNWGADKPASEKVSKLQAARDQLTVLDTYAEEGAPLGMRWGMYSGETLHPALLDAYAGHLERGMASPARKRLELDLKNLGMSQVVPINQYGRMYDRLKLYLMLFHPEHLEVSWAAPRLTKVWGEILHDTTDETAARMRPHVDYYLQLIKDEKIPAWPGAEPLVARARSVLLRAPRIDRAYDLLVREANEQVAPIRREQIFTGSVRAYISAHEDRFVPGAYTHQGWLMVRKELRSEESRLTGEKWVLGESEALISADIEGQIAKLEKLYFERFQASWRAFLADIIIERPEDSITALKELNALSEPEWPYLRLLRILHENVTLPMEEEKTVTEGLVEKAKEEVKERVLGEKEEKARERSSVELAFAPLTAFAIAQDDEGASTGLAEYQAILAKLIAILTDLRHGDTPTSTKEVENEFQTAFRETSALLTQQNGFTRPLISPLLMRPILGTWTGVANDVGGATEGLWIVSVFEKWDQNLGPNYPFSTSLKDAELEEFVSFFSPHGALWTFYDQNLKGSLKKVGDSYVPTRRFDSTVNFSGDFLSNCLSRGRKITDAFFPQEAAAPKVEFLVNLHSVSENVSDVMLTIDGKSQSYRNTPEEWLAAAWPSTEGEPGAQLRIQGLSGLDEEIIRAGEFGVFRLLDAASKLEPGTASDQAGGAPTLVATYEFPSERAVLRLDIRAKTGLAVFDPELLRGYNCPRIITTGR